MSANESLHLITDLSHEIDVDTRAWSTGFNRHRHYDTLISYGSTAVPELVNQLAEGKFWVWRTELICEITEKLLDRCVYFEPEISGKRDLVLQHIAKWWDIEGEEAFSALGNGDVQ